MHCPKCGSEHKCKNGFAKGVQRYLCKGCGCQYTRSTKHGHDDTTKRVAVLLYTLGLSMNSIARTLHVSCQTILRWVRDHAQEHVALPKPDGSTREIELDEMCTHLVKKNAMFGSGKLLITTLKKSLPCILVTALPNRSTPC